MGTQDKGSRSEAAEVQVLCRGGWSAESVRVWCRWAFEPSRARTQRAQMFTLHLWKVCIESDEVNCASKVTGHSCGGCLDTPGQSRQAEEERQVVGLIEACGLVGERAKVH